MPEKYNILLSDSSVRPDDDLVFELIGGQKDIWLLITDYCRDKYNACGDWNYYRDGKRWLFKMQKGKRTLFWAAVTDMGFILTFYFGDKAENDIISGELGPEIKEQFINAKRFGSVRGITFENVEPHCLEDIRRLIDLKVRIK